MSATAATSEPLNLLDLVKGAEWKINSALAADQFHSGITNLIPFEWHDRQTKVGFADFRYLRQATH